MTMYVMKAHGGGGSRFIAPLISTSVSAGGEWSDAFPNPFSHRKMSFWFQFSRRFCGSHCWPGHCGGGQYFLLLP